MKTAPEFSRYKAQITEEIRVESIKAVEMGRPSFAFAFLRPFQQGVECGTAIVPSR